MNLGLGILGTRSPNLTSIGLIGRKQYAINVII